MEYKDIDIDTQYIEAGFDEKSCTCSEHQAILDNLSEPVFTGIFGVSVLNPSRTFTLIPTTIK